MWSHHVSVSVSLSLYLCLPLSGCGCMDTPCHKQWGDQQISAELRRHVWDDMVELESDQIDRTVRNLKCIASTVSIRKQAVISMED